MDKPKREDYFKYRGKQMIMNDGDAENFMEAQDDFIEYQEGKINELQKEIEIYEPYKNQINIHRQTF